MLGGSLLGSPSQQRAVQDMMKNVDLVLLRDGQCDYDVDVTAGEEDDGHSTLFLRIQRRRQVDGSSSPTGRSPYQIGLNPDRCSGIKLHGPGLGGAPDFLGLPRKDARDLGNTFEQYSQFSEFQGRDSRPEEASLRLQQKLLDQDLRISAGRMPMDRF